MRSGRLGGAILATVALLGSGQAAARPKPVAILAKVDTSLAARDADKAECRRIVDKAPGRDMPAVERTNVGAPMDGSGGAPAVAGASDITATEGALVQEASWRAARQVNILYEIVQKDPLLS